MRVKDNSKRSVRTICTFWPQCLQSGTLASQPICLFLLTEYCAVLNVIVSNTHVSH